MKQLLVRNLETNVIDRLKKLAAENGVSAEEQHRRLLTEAFDTAAAVKEPLADYLLKHPVLPQVEIPIERSRVLEERKPGI